MEALKVFKRKVKEVRDTYQREDSASLRRRRKIVLLSLLGIGNAGVMTLHQTGIIPRLPDLPYKLFDATQVTKSTKAYEFGLPDAPGASALYSLIMMAATFGGKRGIMRPLFVDKILLGLTTINAIAALQYIYNMATKQRKVCLYCVGAAAINCAMVPISFQELKEDYQL